MMCHPLQRTLIAALILGTLTAASPAAIVALDPDDSQGGFTTSTTILTDEGVGAPAAGDNDGAWGFSNNNTQATIGGSLSETAALDNEVWVSRNDLGENVPLLTTTISGLLDTSTYNIYVYYVTNENVTQNPNWGLRAAASGQTLNLYDKTTGVSLEDDGTLHLRRALVLGGATPGGGSLALDIDSPASTSGNVRAFYKGVGVEALAAIPAPAALPAGLMMLSLIGLRRRR
jgi:VCBS repeat-containing protein